MRKLVSVSVLLTIFLSVNIHSLNAIGEKHLYEKGKIIDSVRCNNYPKYSYALYLPHNYTDNVKWPIIFIFDPGARGKPGLSGFIPAAEKFGYIAVCSNNSRNFMSGTELSEVINSMFTDVEARFSIDRGRIYTAGFSGGSRVAAMIALDNKKISGVIACGAGLPFYADLNDNPSFNYFGIVGNHDMNYTEMCDLEKKLNDHGISEELRIFNGGHNWPSPELLEEAVEWFELKAMYKGTKSKNPDFINEMFSRYNKKALSLSEQEKYIESASYYRYIIRDFPDHSAIPKTRATLDSLIKTKSYAKSFKILEKNRSLELEIQSKLVQDLNERVRTEELPDSIRNWWTGQIKSLRFMEAGKDINKQDIASRVLMLLNAICYETGRNSTELKKFQTASICYQLASIVDPENKNVYFLLARTYSLNGETNSAIRSLENAIKKGYTNKQSIEKDSAFIPLRSDRRFREIIIKLK